MSSTNIPLVPGSTGDFAVVRDFFPTDEVQRRHALRALKPGDLSDFLAAGRGRKPGWKRFLRRYGGVCKSLSAVCRLMERGFHQTDPPSPSKRDTEDRKGFNFEPAVA